MSSIGKIFTTIVTIGFMIVGSIVGGPIGAFIGSLIGQLIGGAISSALFSGKSGTTPEAGKVNVRLPEPPRWLCAGQNKQGGGALFGEFDSAGNFWYVLVHCDSILVNRLQYYLDNIPITVNGSGVVLTKEFRLKNNKQKDPATFDGEGVGYFQIWTTTYDASDPTPPAISALSAACPQWTSDHKLVGTTYSVVKMSAISIEHRSKVAKWRGPFQIGEPSLAIAGEWSTAYDPRDVAQDVSDATTHEYTRNSVLQWAWFRTHRYGRNKPHSSINWDKVAEQAEICDQTVTGINGDTIRYRCDIAIPEDKTRALVEQEIMATMDAQLVFDEDGKCWPRVGYYYTPTLKLTRNRDIVGMESIEAQNGESETQGVIVRYTNVEAGYVTQPAAAWYNPLYYVEGEAANFLTVDILSIQDHNQAMRIAKAIGLRLQPEYKIVPTTGLRGLRAMRERIVDLLYDNTFAGDHEIVTQVEMDKSGQLCRIGMVPVNEDRWNLSEDEERQIPVTENPGDLPDVPDLPDNVDLTYTNNRLEATFDPPTRDDVVYQFEYVITDQLAGDIWTPMTVLINDGIAFSGTVIDNQEYSVRYRSVSNAGRATDWVAVYATVTPVLPDYIPPPNGIIYDGGNVV